jgi:4'-phosphopantetheinyl transferase
MTKKPQLEPNTIHIWHAKLDTSLTQAHQQRDLLSTDERTRADRFFSPKDRCHFIIARATLRRILSLYLSIPASQIEFAYTTHNKPYIPLFIDTPLQFNLSHSHDVAICAVTWQYAVGVDIERVKDTYHEGIAKRYFSASEFANLMALPTVKRVSAFYHLWSRKEALIKATGRGFDIPLHSFSVAIQDIYESVQLEDMKWSLLSLTTYPGYQAALASNQPIKEVAYWYFTNQTPYLDHADTILGR